MRLLAQLDEDGGGWLLVTHPDSATGASDQERLRAAMSACPPSCRVVVVTDRAPGAAFAEARLAGRLVELDRRDLRLSPEEAEELLRQRAPSLAPAEITPLLPLCDGWLAALLLVARRHTAHRDEDPVAWLRTSGAELLIDPWLDQQDPSVVGIFVRTAFLDVLHPDLLDVVLPDSGAGEALLRAARDAGPIARSDSPGHRGRIGYLRHPLLTERLRELATARPAAPKLHVRAAGWMRRHDDLAGELENLLAAGEHRLAAERLYAHEDELFGSGQARVALRWYETVADAPASSMVAHQLRVGWAQALAGDIVAARSTLGRLSARRTVDTPVATMAGEYDSLEGELHALSCWIAHAEGDVIGTVSEAQHAQELFGHDLSRNSHLLAALYRARGLSALGRCTEADEVLRPLRQSTFALTALSEGTRAEIEAELAWEQGRVHECRAWAARRVRWLGDTDRTPLPSSRPPLAWWLARAEEGGYVEAAAGLARIIFPRTESAPIVTDDVLAHVALADIHRGAGRYGAALRVLGDARKIIQARSPQGGLGQRIARSEARIRLLSGDTVRASRALQDSPAVPDVLLLRIRLALYRDTALGRQLIREFEPASPREEAEWAVLAAWSQVDRSRRDAERHLLRAADIAAAQGLTTILVGESPNLIRFAGATARHFVHDALTALVAAAASASPISPRDAPAPVPMVSLTRGELQLIPLLQTRMSNGDIAAHLGISVNTVKTRVRRLFGKLNVGDRRAASRRFAELGLSEKPTNAGE